jgi:hypothetical protein
MENTKGFRVPLACAVVIVSVARSTPTTWHTTTSTTSSTSTSSSTCVCFERKHHTKVCTHTTSSLPEDQAKQALAEWCCQLLCHCCAGHLHAEHTEHRSFAVFWCSFAGHDSMRLTNHDTADNSDGGILHSCSC